MAEKDFERLRKCLLKPKLGLFPAVYVSTREINKLSENELTELGKLGLSLVGIGAIGARSAVYAIHKPKNLNEITKKLKEKDIKYQETKTWAPYCEP